MDQRRGVDSDLVVVLDGSLTEAPDLEVEEGPAAPQAQLAQPPPAAPDFLDVEQAILVNVEEGLESE